MDHNTKRTIHVPKEMLVAKGGLVLDLMSDNSIRITTKCVDRASAEALYETYLDAAASGLLQISWEVNGASDHE